MPRDRDYQKEYQARRSRYKDLPPTVAAGHGALPPFIARKAERGQLTQRERRLYRRQLAAYEARYGPAGARKRPGIRHTFPESFDTREDAEAAAEALRIPPEYYHVVRRMGRWQLVILR